MKLENRVYRDKVHGCWLGKSLGGAIGGPFAGRLEALDLPLEFPDSALENDDLDLQLIGLAVLRQHGLRISAAELADAWLAHQRCPHDEYGVALANLRMGLRPPVSGYYNNWFKDAMGAPIRAELWACLFPGQPRRAAWYACQDAQVDHWGEGVYGEIFLAALESMAFIEPDLQVGMGTALAFIPEGCRVHRAVTLAMRSFADGESLADSRQRVLHHFGHHNYTDCPQNLAFVALGLLHGRGDFLASIVGAANCGYDTSCTAATVGAIAGVVAGAAAVLGQAKVEWDQRVVVGRGVCDCPVPATLEELTSQTVEFGEQAAAMADLPEIEPPFVLSRLPGFTPPMVIPCHVAQIPDNAGEAQPLLTDAADEVVFEGAFFDVEDLLVEADAMLVLETCFELSARRLLRPIPHCTGPVSMWIDDRLVVDWSASAPFLPATHRDAHGRNRMNWEMLDLPAGLHEVTIRIRHPEPGRRLEFAWVVADENQHWVTDLKYLLKP